jgi:hypothetical protein
MSEPRLGALFAAAARETRDDLLQTTWRLVARTSELTAQTSGALARQVDELGGRLSARLSGPVAETAAETVGGWASRAGDALVGLGEWLSGARAARR